LRRGQGLEFGAAGKGRTAARVLAFGGELLWREVRAVFARLDMDGEVRAMDAFLVPSSP